MSHPFHTGLDASHRQREEPRMPVGLRFESAAVSQQDEPIGYSEATDWLRVGDGQVPVIVMLISAVREEAEQIVRRLLVQREATATWEQFYRKVELPSPPIGTVSSVEYYERGDAQWKSVDAADYDVRGRLLELESGNEGSPLRATYQAGYQDVPEQLRIQMLKDLRYSYDHRDPGDQGAARIQDRMAYQRFRPY